MMITFLFSACTSCHGTAQSYSAPLVQPGKMNDLNQFVPLNEKLSQDWCVKSGTTSSIHDTDTALVRFANIKAGETFSVRGALSADYSLQFVIGWTNYQTWKKNEATPKNVLVVPGRRVVFKRKPEDEPDDEKRGILEEMIDTVKVEVEPLRSGPHMHYNPDI